MGLLGCSVAARRFLRFRRCQLEPVRVGRLPRLACCGAAGRCGGRAADRRFGRFPPSRGSAGGEPRLAARPRFRFAVAIAVCCSRTRVRWVSRRRLGLVLLRSISSSALQVAIAVVEARLGFASRMGCRGGGSVGRFVRDLSVPGRACRGNGAVELAPAVRQFAGGTSVAGSLCEVAREGWGPFLAVGRATNQHLDRPRIASRFGVGLVANRSVRAPVSWTNSVLLRSPPPSQVATSFTIFRWTVSRS